MRKKIPKKFFARPTLRVARALLGKYLVVRSGNILTSGMVVETEAYVGEDDLACHASRGRTARTEMLYAAPGTAYVYLIYGMYYCFNVVTERTDFPSAVLIRALEPVDGVSVMQKRRSAIGEPRLRWGVSVLHALASGPGKLCGALGIDRRMHGRPTYKDEIFFEDRGVKIARADIIAVPRVGVDYAKHCKDYPWRFYIKDNPFISRR